MLMNQHPYLMMELARLHQQDILNSLYRVHTDEPLFNLRASILALWHRWHTPHTPHTPQPPTQTWKPTRTIRT